VLQLSERNERLAESASTDVLTGLLHRRMLDRALGRLSADDTVIVLDLDHFKRVNDNFGHAAGDEVLRVFGRVLRATPSGDSAVRSSSSSSPLREARTPFSGGYALHG
jgi:diguanylate cyclase (GGDEF)-like protein